MTRIAVELNNLLREAGWEFLRQARGDHEIWWNPVTNHKLTIDNNSKSRHLANDLLKFAGLLKIF